MAKKCNTFCILLWHRPVWRGGVCSLPLLTKCTFSSIFGPVNGCSKTKRSFWSHFPTKGCASLNLNMKRTLQRLFKLTDIVCLWLDDSKFYDMVDPVEVGQISLTNPLSSLSMPSTFIIWPFLCRLRSIATHRDHFVCRSVCLSVGPSVCPSVCLSVCHTHRAMFRRRHMHSSEWCHYFNKILPCRAIELQTRTSFDKKMNSNMNKNLSLYFCLYFPVFFFDGSVKLTIIWGRGSIESRSVLTFMT